MRFTILIAAAAALSLSACSKKSEDTATTTATTETASTEKAKTDCSLLSAEEVGAITTDKVNAVKQWDDGCKYSSDPSDDGITLIAVATGGADRMKIMHKTAEVLQGMGGAVADKGGAGADVAAALKKDGSAAPKLGDEAMWGPNTTLAVRRGDAYVEVSPPLMHDPANHSGYPLVSTDEKRAIAIKVAEAALAKLK